MSILVTGGEGYIGSHACVGSAATIGSLTPWAENSAHRALYKKNGSRRS